jgi:hypothetical protein
MGAGGLVPSVVGVGVVASLLPVTWKRLSFQLLNLDSFKVNQTKVKIPLLEELNVSNKHRRYFVVGFHLSPLSLAV